MSSPLAPAPDPAPMGYPEDPEHAGTATPARPADRPGGGPPVEPVEHRRIQQRLDGAALPVGSRLDAGFSTGEHLSDGYLVSRAKAGSAEAFEVLVERYGDRVFRVAYRLIGDRSTAEDVAQDSLVSAWRAIGGFRGEAQFSTWLHQITVNAVRSYQSHRRFTDQLTGEEPLAPDEQPENLVESRTRDDALHQAMRSLPFDQHAPLVLVQFEGLSYEQTAEVLGLSTSTVRGRLARARQALLTSLEEWR